MKAVICSVIHKLGTFSRQSATSRTIFTAGLNGVRPEHEGYATDNGGKIYLSDVMQNIKENTEISRDHLTPEIALHLITPNCKLWTALDGDIIFPDPFWAFYWPGGQVLTRYIHILYIVFVCEMRTPHMAIYGNFEHAVHLISKVNEAK